MPLGNIGLDVKEKQFPEVFKACTVIRAMSATNEVAWDRLIDGTTDLLNSPCLTLLCLCHTVTW